MSRKWLAAIGIVVLAVVVSVGVVVGVAFEVQYSPLTPQAAHNTIDEWERKREWVIPKVGSASNLATPFRRTVLNRGMSVK